LVEVVGKLVAEFWKLEDQRLWLERPGVRIYILLLGPLPSWARLADHLAEATRQLGAELATWWEVDAEREVLQTLAAWIRDLVLDNADGPSSLATSISMVAELLEGWVDVAASNGVHCGTQSALVAALPHFSKLEAKLELLESGRNTILVEDLVDAQWILAHPASDSLALYVLPSITRHHPDGTGE
jgi:hypothetical protein